jgi:hypothetical protein
MKTDDLIAALSREVPPVSRAELPRRIAVATVAGVSLTLFLLWLTLGLRNDMVRAAAPIALKTAFAALATVVSGYVAIRFARPGGRAAWLAAVGAVLVGGLVVAAAALVGLEPGDRLQAWLAGGFPSCIAGIPLLSVPIALLLIWAWREAAPTRLALAGAAIGATAGGLAAMIYALYCPIDSVAYVTTWYGVGIGLSAALGALLGTRLLRW